MAWRSNKKGLAVVGLFLFLMGVAVPAAFGLLTEKAMGLGVGDLLDKSTNWDSSNIANSTYFTNIVASFSDNETAQQYRPDLVVDSDNDLHLIMNDKTNILSSYAGGDKAFIEFDFNKTNFEKVDKIIVVIDIEDLGSIQNLSKLVPRVTLQYSDGGPWTTEKVKPYNLTANASSRVEIELNAIDRLKLQDKPVRLLVYLSQSTDEDLDNAVWGAKVELYDVKKVNASAASNIMLAVSGVLGWLGALAATPYWNPYANREHRNIRRVGRAVRRIRRRRR